MKTPRPIPGLWVWIVVVATTCLGTGCSTGPCIRGSYVLEHRDLPDGRQVRSPEVIGMMTFTRDRRNSLSTIYNMHSAIYNWTNPE